MKLFRYRKPSLKTVLGVTKAKKQVKRSLGITAAMKPFRAFGNAERRVKRKIGYYSPASKLLRLGFPVLFGVRLSRRKSPKATIAIPSSSPLGCLLLLSGVAGLMTISSMLKPAATKPITVLRTSAQTQAVDDGNLVPTIASSATNAETVASGSASAEADVDLSPASETENPKSTIAEESNWRTWTDASGGYSVEALFGGMISDKVKLTKRNGKVLKLPLDKLSDVDREWIAKHRAR